MNSSDKETRPFFGPPLKASVSVEEMILGSKLVRSCHVTNNYSNSKKQIQINTLAQQKDEYRKV